MHIPFRCIEYGVRIAEEPHRRAPNCYCGVLWQAGARQRAQWCQRLPAALEHLTVDGRNPRRMHFHNFGGNVQPDNSAMAQFVDFLLHHGPLNITTLALSHNGVRHLLFFSWPLPFLLMYIW